MKQTIALMVPGFIFEIRPALARISVLEVVGYERDSGAKNMRFHPWYGLLLFFYMIGIYRLSSIPGFEFQSVGPLGRLLHNLLHVPLYAGLAFFFLQTTRGGFPIRGTGWRAYALALVGAVAYAAFDEWHQSFVPERSASMGDFLLDVGGIVGMLLTLRPWTSRERSRPV